MPETIQTPENGSANAPSNYEKTMADAPAFDQQAAEQARAAEVEPAFEKISLDTPELDARFAGAEVFHKKGSISAVQITAEGLQSGAYADKDIRFDETAGEYVIDTYVMRTKEDGSRVAELEDTRKVEPGEWLATNPLQQEGDRENNYAIPDATFKKRYEASDTPGVYRAKGMARIIKNDTGRSVQIEAPWGGTQEGDASCYFCAPYDRENPDDLAEGHRYILSENDFAAYAPASEVLGEDWDK